MSISKQASDKIVAWMNDVFTIVAFFYGEIPLTELYKVFLAGSEVIPEISNMDMDMFRYLITSSLSSVNFLAAEKTDVMCRVEGDMVISNFFGAGDGYPELDYIRSERKIREELGYRILSFDEIMQYLEEKHLSSDEYNALETFLENSFHFSYDVADDIAKHMAYYFWSTGDILDGFNEIVRSIAVTMGVSKPLMTKETFSELMNLTNGLYTVTGQMEMFGWSPKEVYKKRYGKDAPVARIGSDGLMINKPDIDLNNTTFIPGSSKAAEDMKANKALLESLGFKIDINGGASFVQSTVMSPEGTPMMGSRRKIYRNDPCPCGSGKKFKRCCGLNNTNGI